MLTKEQKLKKLEILSNSYNIQYLVSKTIEENIESYSPNYGDNLKEVRVNLRDYTRGLEQGIQFSSSLFSSNELSSIQTVLTSSTLYGS
tara:strand:- start:519 stop:785 length:267 start_codon:yes stop_codon:yes gene_type:complete